MAMCLVVVEPWMLVFVTRRGKDHSQGRQTHTVSIFLVKRHNQPTKSQPDKSVPKCVFTCPSSIYCAGHGHFKKKKKRIPGCNCLSKIDFVGAKNRPVLTDLRIFA